MHSQKSNHKAANPHFKGAKSAEIKDLTQRERSVTRLADACANWMFYCLAIKAIRYGHAADTVNGFIEAQRKLNTAIKGVQQWE